MSIDRVGGKAPSHGVAPGGPDAAERAGKPFEVGAAEAGRLDAAEAKAASNPLARLRAGEIDARTYVDLKVDEATRHLTLPPEDLQTIRAELRDRMLADPALADLVRNVTGVALSPPDE